MSWFKRVESFLEKVDDSVNARLNDDDDDSFEDEYEDEYGRVEEYDNASNIPEEERKDALGFVTKELAPESSQGDQPNKDDSSTSTTTTENPPTTTNNNNNNNNDNITNEAIEKVIRENKIFRAEILKQAKEIDRLKKDDVRLRTLELEATTNKELIDTLRSTLDEAIRDKAALEAELAGEVEGHRATRESAQQREEQLESYIETYVASISTANTQLQEKEAELTEAKDALIALQNDNDKLRGEIEALKLLNSDLAAKLQPQPSEAAVDADENKKEEEEKEEVTEHKGGEDECDALRKSLEDSLRTIEELQQKVAELTAKGDALEQDLGRFTQAAKEKDEHIVQLTQDSDRAAQALSDAKKEVLRLEGETKALSERAAKAEGAADKLRRQLAAKSVLSAEHMQLEARVRVLTDSLGAAQAQLEDIVHENQRLHILAGATPEEAAEAARKYTAGTALPLGGRKEKRERGEEENPRNVVGTLTRFVYQNFDTFERSFAAKHLLPFAAKYDSVEMKAQHIFGSSFFLRLMVYLYVVVIQVWWFIVVLRDLSEH